MMFFWIWTGFKRCVWHSGSQDFAKTLDYELRYTWKNSWVVFIVVVRAHFVWWGYIRQFWSALRCSTGKLPRSASLCGLRLQALRDSTTPVPHAHCFADDTQRYLSFNPNNPTDQAEAVRAMETCLYQWLEKMDVPGQVKDKWWENWISNYWI